MKRTRRSSSVRLTLIASAVLLCSLTSPIAHAFPAIIIEVVEGFKTAKEAYSAYKQGRDLLNPQPSTAELIAQAVDRVENLIVDGASRTVLTHAKIAIATYKDAMFSTAPADLLKRFDKEASDSLIELETFLGPGSDPRYARALGGVYNVLLPLYLANHLKGVAWGSTIPRGQLEIDFISRAKTGLQLDYDFVGGRVTGTTPTDTTPTSRLRAWVNASARNQGSIVTTPGLQVVYFKTNQTVQEVQRGAAGLFTLLQSAGVDPSRLFDNPARKTVTVDLAGWTDNWMGRADGIWTSVQPRVYDSQVLSEPCPPDHGMVAVWQLRYGMASLLCVPWPNMTAPNVWTTVYNVQMVRESCPGGTLCTEGTACPGNDFAQSVMFGALECVNRVDHGKNILPTRDASVWFEKRFPGLTDAGVQFDLPTGTALTGYDPTAYQSGWISYFYATYKIPPKLPFLGWQVSGSGGSWTSAPGLTMRTSNSIDLFGRGTDNALYYSYAFSLDQGGTWTWLAPQSLGGQLLGKPAATAWGPSTRNLAVIGRGTDSKAYVRVCAAPSGSCSFTPWEAIPNGLFSNDPTIVFKDPYLYAIGPGTDNRVYWSRNNVGSGYSSQGWTSWQPVAYGIVNSAVAAAVVDGTIYVTARASNTHFWWTRSVDGLNWFDWTDFGGPAFASAPAISGSTGGKLYLSGTESGSNQVLVTSSGNGGSDWSAFQSVGGIAVGSPALWSPPSGKTELFVIGADAFTMFRAMNN